MHFPQHRRDMTNGKNPCWPMLRANSFSTVVSCTHELTSKMTRCASLVLGIVEIADGKRFDGGLDFFPAQAETQRSVEAIDDMEVMGPLSAQSSQDVNRRVGSNVSVGPVCRGSLFDNFAEGAAA